MFHRYRSLAIFLREKPLGEADLLFTVFAKKYGKLEILGKGIRKIKSKLRGSANLFYLSEIEFIQGKNFKTLTSAILIENFPLVKNSLEKLKYSFEIGKFSEIFLPLEEKEDSLWELLIETFFRLERIKEEKGFVVFYFFLWQFFAILGFGPELKNCIRCQKKLSLPGPFYFIPEEGGIGCADCFCNRNNYLQIFAETIKILRIFNAKDWTLSEKLFIEKKVKENLREISQAYSDFLKSANF